MGWCMLAGAANQTIDTGWDESSKPSWERPYRDPFMLSWKSGPAQKVWANDPTSSTRPLGVKVSFVRWFTESRTVVESMCHWGRTISWHWIYTASIYPRRGADLTRQTCHFQPLSFWNTHSMTDHFSVQPCRAGDNSSFRREKPQLKKTVCLY